MNDTFNAADLLNSNELSAEIEKAMLRGKHEGWKEGYREGLKDGQEAAHQSMMKAFEQLKKANKD